MTHATGAKKLWRVGACAAGLALVISLFAFPTPAFSRPRKQGVTVALYRGAEVLKGELIGIRADAVVIKLEKGENAVLLAEIDRIKVSRGLNRTGGTIGAIAGGIAGVIVANSLKPKDPYAGINTLNDWAVVTVNETMMSVVRPFAGLSVGMLGGGLLGAAVGTAATKAQVIQLRGRPEAAVNADLDKLRKKARVPDYR